MSEKSQNKSVITGLLYRVQPRKTKTGNFCLCHSPLPWSRLTAKQYIFVVGMEGIRRAGCCNGSRLQSLRVGPFAVGLMDRCGWNKRYKTEIVADTVEEIASLHSSPSPEALQKRPIDDSDIPF